MPKGVYNHNKDRQGFQKGHRQFNTGRTHFRKGVPGYWANKKRPNNSKRGPESNLWKGGVTSINQKIRMSTRYKRWRKAVFERDNYMCVWCGIGGRLHADHIKEFSLYPKSRFLIDNGRTLCIGCHKKTNSYGKNTIKIKKT